MKARKYVIANYFDNEPDLTDLKLVEEELRSLKDGEYLVEAEFFSVDSYIRNYVKNFPLGTTMIGSQVAKIIESKNSYFRVGRRIVGYLGWRTHTIVNPNVKDPTQMIPTYILPDIGDLPPSLALGVLGMPGNIAYFGLDLCEPKPGETIVISGAAGTIGSHVGQLAKSLGMTVIGICGSEEKCVWLKELHFDFVMNYRTIKGSQVAASIRKVAPQGVDCYFDNVGGDISCVMDSIKPYGRIVAVGVSISSDENSSSFPKSTILQPIILFNKLSMSTMSTLSTCSSRVTGFIVPCWTNRWNERIMDKNLQFIRDDKLHYRETVTNGFENMIKVFIGVLRGENIGKAIVRV